jgi:hypothetical protein
MGRVLLIGAALTVALGLWMLGSSGLVLAQAPPEQVTLRVEGMV